MDSKDFIKLNGLLAKLISATNKAKKIDGTFRRYHAQSVEELKGLPSQLARLEQDLITAKIIKP